MVHSNFLDPDEGLQALGRSWEDPTDISACLVECAKRLHGSGYLAATDGNISLRLSDDEIWITPTDCMKAFAQPDNMAVINARNKIEKGLASSERLLHLTIYKHAPLARAVVLAHPPAAISLTLAHPEWKGVPQDILPSLILSLGEVPIIPFALPGTEEMAVQLIPYLPQSRVMILARQAVLSWGETLDEAYMGIERLEHACIVISRAQLLGPMARLTPTEVATLQDARRTNGDKTI